MESNNINEIKTTITESLDSVTVAPGIQDGVVFKKEETKERMLMRENFPFFALGSLIYAVIATFCIYNNLCGITTSIFIIATLAYAYLGINKMGYKAAKKHVMYAIAITLLGINLFYTLDYVLIFVDYVAIILLFASGLLSFIYDDSKWSLGEALLAILDQIFGALGDTFSFEFTKDWSLFNKDKNSKSAVFTYVIIGFLCAIPLLVIVILLLCSADAVFNQAIENIFGDISFGGIIGRAFLFVGALFGSYTWFTKLFRKNLHLELTDKRVLEPIVMIIINCCLGIVYLFFCGIQVVYLFAGVGELPSGYTYAAYAREGFFQLLFVCFINLMLILIGIKRFKKNTVLSVVMTIITACTYIMIVSSIYRMYLYISEYQLTLLRVWVLFALILITAILTGALVSIFNDNMPLFKYCIVATTVLYILFAFARPASIVANYNLSDSFDENEIDYEYLVYNLNPDAAKAMDECSDGKNRERYYTNMSNWYDRDDLRCFNISRYTVEKYK